MKLKQALLLSILPIAANAQEINQTIDWDQISSTPTIDQQIIKQDFIPANDAQQNNFVQEDLAGFEFLNKSIDDRIFYNFNSKVRVLNKYTDQITDYTLKQDETLELKKFKLTVKSCANVQINNVETQMAFIELYKKDQLVFNGWMSNIHKNMNFPEIRELYINLISCFKTDLKEESVEVAPVQELLAPTELKPLKFEN